jgi:transcriptional regulator with XRE-family HTH domain
MKDDNRVLTIDELYGISDPKKIIDNLVRQNIRIRLTAMGKTQRWLARKLGKSEPYLSQYLSFNGTGLSTLLPSIADVLGLRPHDLTRVLESEVEEKFLEAVRTAKKLGRSDIIKEHLYMFQQRIQMAMEEIQKPPGSLSSSVA